MSKHSLLLNTIGMFIVILFVIEGLSRCYLFIKFKHFFPNHNTILNTYYPKLNNLRQVLDNANDNNYEVLVLGASVLTETYMPFSEQLQKKLSKELNTHVRVTNLAESAHSTRDSLIKYQSINQSFFDLVIVYHGINELRTNHIPDHLFRNDYTHVDWYFNIAKHLSNTHHLSYLATPFIVSLLSYHLQHRPPSLLPHTWALTEWLKHGMDVKSQYPFQTNLTTIINIAKKRHEKVMLMTYVHHIPKSYSHTDFESKKGDYSFGKKSFPIRIWGNKDSISLGLKTHNRIIHNLHNNHNQLLFVDQQKHIPKNKENFIDVCHLSTSGGTIFIDNVINVIKQDIAQTENLLSSHKSRDNTSIIIAHSESTQP